MSSWTVAKCGARFSFGGKLITFDQSIASDAHNQTAPWRHININQVITEFELYQKSFDLNELLSNTNVLAAASDLCDKRTETCKNDFDRKTWQFLKAHLERKPRSEYTKILGFQFESALERVKNIVPYELSSKSEVDSQANSNRLNESHGSYQSNPCEAFQNGRIDDTQSEQTEGEDVEDEIWHADPISLTSDGQSDESLLCHLVASGRYEAAVNWCIEKNRWIDALQLALVSGTSFYKEVQRKYFETCRDPMSKIITLIANEKWSTLASGVDLNNWPMSFSFLLNYVPGRELTSYLKTLGNRLENENEGRFRMNSTFCYICAGLIDSFVRILTKSVENRETSMNLHDLIEKAIVLRCSLGGGSQRIVDVGEVFASKLGDYASILVEQGFLASAYQLLDDLPEDTDVKLMILRYRLYTACCGLLPPTVKRPKNPFPAPISMNDLVNKTRLMNVQRRPSAPQGYQQPTPNPWNVPSSGQNFQQWNQTPSNVQTFQPPLRQQWAGQGFQQPPQQWVATSNVQSFHSPSPQWAAPTNVQSYQPQVQQWSVQSYPSPIQSHSQTFQSTPAPQYAFQPSSPQFTVQPPAATSNPQQYQYLNNLPQSQNVYSPTSYENAMHHQQPQPIPPPPTSFARVSDQAQPISAAKTSRARYPSYNNADGAAYPNSGTTIQHHDGPHHHGMNPYQNSQHQFTAPLPNVSMTPSERQEYELSHWNDPPPLSPKKKFSVQDNLEPLKHPFGSFPDSSSQSNTGQSPSVYSESNVQSSDVGNYTSSHERSPSVKQQEEKIPTEYEIFFNVLDRLAELILHQAQSLQIRRRIEENKHKLDEHLRSQLIKRKLSDVTLADLYQIISNIQSHNYPGAMQIHQKMAQGRDFDNISGFMPALKVLLQTAMQSNVFYG